MYIMALVVFWLTAELGDYDEEDHTPAFISEFRFMPNQSEDMEMEIYQKYQSLRYAKQRTSRGHVYMASISQYTQWSCNKFVILWFS